MMNSFRRLLALTVPCVAMLGIVPEASRAANPPVYVPDPIQVPCTLTMQKIRSVVRVGVLGRGWTVKEPGDGVVEARLDKDRYVVIVTITYDPKAVRIQYKDSENLEYEGSGAAATIKRGYNNWIKNIEKDIAVELSRSCG
jgi:hypothetical protein